MGKSLKSSRSCAIHRSSKFVINLFPWTALFPFMAPHNHNQFVVCCEKWQKKFITNRSAKYLWAFCLFAFTSLSRKFSCFVFIWDCELRHRGGDSWIDNIHKSSSSTYFSVALFISDCRQKPAKEIDCVWCRGIMFYLSARQWNSWLTGWVQQK